MRKVAEDYRKTPEGIAAGKLINSDIAPEDYAVDIPDFPDLPDGYDVADRW
jgi:hypothetical protein